MCSESQSSTCTSCFRSCSGHGMRHNGRPTRAESLGSLSESGGISFNMIEGSSSPAGKEFGGSHSADLTSCNQVYRPSWKTRLIVVGAGTRTSSSAPSSLSGSAEEDEAVDGVDASSSQIKKKKKAVSLGFVSDLRGLS